MNLLGPEDFGETIVYFGIGTFVKKVAVFKFIKIICPVKIKAPVS